MPKGKDLLPVKYKHCPHMDTFRGQIKHKQFTKNNANVRCMLNNQSLMSLFTAMYLSGAVSDDYISSD